MNKDFIPYEEALVLKELGFSEKCLADWFVFGPKYEHLTLVIGSDIDLEEKQEELNMIAFHHLRVPLYQQAFRWFREKGYLISVDSLTSIEHEFYIKWDADKSILSDQYSTYEEAELECLRKLIKIVKEKEI